VGTHAIGASYGGDTNHAGSSASPPFAEGATVTVSVGGVVVPVDKLALLAPYLSLATAIAMVTAGAIILLKRFRPRKSEE
jgi:hypothetical protein